MKNRFLKICIVFFITGLIISALAFISFYAKLRDAKAESVTSAAEYIIDYFDEDNLSTVVEAEHEENWAVGAYSDNSFANSLLNDGVSAFSAISLDELTPEELADVIEVSSHAYLMTDTAIEDVYSYSIPDGAFCGKEDPVLSRLHPERAQVRTSSGYIYTPYTYSQDITLWFRNSAEPLDAEFSEYVQSYSFIFIISYIIVCLILAILMKLWVRNPKILRGVYITLFVWIIAMYGLFAIGMSNVDLEYGKKYADTRLYVINADVRAYLDIPDDEIGQIYESFIVEAPGYADLPSETANDKRLVLLKATIEMDGKTDPSSVTFIPRDNIWDIDVPIESRVDTEWDYYKYAKMLMDYLLQTIMVGVFAALLMSQILSLDNEKTFNKVTKPEGIDEDRFSILLHNTSNMKHLLIVKSFATTLVAVLHMSMVKSWLRHDYGVYPSIYVTTVIFGASLLGCLTVFAAPQLYKLCKNSMNFTRIALPICAAGALTCFFAQNSTVFIIGYLIIAVGDGLSNMAMIIFTMSHDTEAEGLFALRQISTAAIIGSILGAVVGGIIAVVIDTRYMYLISAICVIAMVFYSFTIPADTLSRKLPERTELARIIRNKEAILFFVLIMIPLGFQSYFFTYSVSIDAADLGLTTVVVSFVYFVRNAFKLFIKKSDPNRKFWKKFPLNITAPLCLILSGLVFLAYIPFRSAVGLLIISIALAYVEASLNSRIYAYNFVLLDSDMNSAFGNSAMIVTGRRIGKTLAPMLVQAFNPIVLPVVMFAGGSVYLIKNHLNKK